jgi:hypothetical protein
MKLKVEIIGYSIDIICGSVSKEIEQYIEGSSLCQRFDFAAA